MPPHVTYRSHGMTCWRKCQMLQVISTQAGRQSALDLKMRWSRVPTQAQCLTPRAGQGWGRGLRSDGEDEWRLEQRAPSHKPCCHRCDVPYASPCSNRSQATNRYKEQIGRTASQLLPWQVIHPTLSWAIAPAPVPAPAPAPRYRYRYREKPGAAPKASASQKEAAHKRHRYLGVLPSSEAFKSRPLLAVSTRKSG